MAYVTLAQAKAWVRVPDWDPVDDDQFTAAIDAAEGMITQYCGRDFNAAGTVASARVYTTSYPTQVEVDDIPTTTGLVLKTDEDGDGTFETTWTSNDYQLEPLNNLTKSWPAWRIRAVGDYLFPTGSSWGAQIQVTARWGWSAVPAAVAQATTIQAARFVRRREAVFGVIDLPVAGVAERLYPSLDPDTRILLDPYRKVEMA